MLIFSYVLMLGGKQSAMTIMIICGNLIDNDSSLLVVIFVDVHTNVV